MQQIITEKYHFHGQADFRIVSIGKFNTENGTSSYFLDYESALRFQKELINKIIQGYQEDVFKIEMLILKEKENQKTIREIGKIINS